MTPPVPPMDDMGDELDDALHLLVQRYWAGTATVAERVRLEHWIAQNPRRAVEVDAVGRFGAAYGAWAQEAPVDPHADLLQLRARLHPSSPPSSSPSQVATLHRLWPQGVGGGGNALRLRPLLVVAAALVLAVGVIDTGYVVSRSRAPQPFRELASASRGRATVTLRDGTQLVLGPASHLRIPADFGRASRTVELDGQALFRVVHDQRHPFAVRTARATVRDVGTVFVMDAYASDPEIRVAVAEGEVMLNAASAPPTALRAHDVAIVDPMGRVAVSSGADLAAYLAWAQGALVFDGAPLRDVARTLSRVYGLDITLGDSALAGDCVTARFDDEPADQVLNIIAHAVNAHIEREGRRVILMPGIPGTRNPDRRRVPPGSETATVVRGAAGNNAQ